MKFLLILIISAIIMGLMRIYVHRKNKTLATVFSAQLYKEAPRQTYELLFCDDLHEYEK